MFGFDFAEVLDSVTDIAEDIARVTGNDELADLIDTVDDVLEEIVED